MFVTVLFLSNKYSPHRLPLSEVHPIGRTIAVHHSLQNPNEIVAELATTKNIKFAELYIYSNTCGPTNILFLFVAIEKIGYEY